MTAVKRGFIGTGEYQKRAFFNSREYKEFYMPEAKTGIIIVPKANYIAVRGKGDPNEG